MNDHEKRVLQLIGRVAGPEAADRIDLDAQLLEEKILDSFGLVSVVAELEEEFDIALGADELVVQNFETPRSIVNLITRLK